MTVLRYDELGKMIPIECPDGRITHHPYWRGMRDPRYVLIAEGGHAYHDYVGCYLDWEPRFRRGFTGWKAVLKEDAIAQGYTFCQYCAMGSRGGPAPFCRMRGDEPLLTFEVTVPDLPPCGYLKEQDAMIEIEDGIRKVYVEDTYAFDLPDDILDGCDMVFPDPNTELEVEKVTRFPDSMARVVFGVHFRRSRS